MNLKIVVFKIHVIDDLMKIKIARIMRISRNFFPPLITSSARSYANVIFVPGLSCRFTKDSSEHIGTCHLHRHARDKTTLYYGPRVYICVHARGKARGERERERSEVGEGAIKKRRSASNGETRGLFAGGPHWLFGPRIIIIAVALLSFVFRRGCFSLSFSSLRISAAVAA